jgi:protein ImuA
MTRGFGRQSPGLRNVLYERTVVQMDFLPASPPPPVRTVRPAAGVPRALYRPMGVPVTHPNQAEKNPSVVESEEARITQELFAQTPQVEAPPPKKIPLRPESFHPALWLGHQLGRHAEAAVPSGFPALDAQLPGGGWPRRGLTELLLPHPGIGEIRLLCASLVATQRADRLVMLFDPPAQLSAAALAQLGLDVEQLLIINTRARVIPGTDSLWALEQALKSGHVGAVLAWLPPRLRAERLRRLQLAAHAHDGPAFVLREMSASQRPTAAPLRLALRSNGADVLAVKVLKRRGPPLSAPLRLALPGMLSDMARQRSKRALDQGRTEVDGVDGTAESAAGAAEPALHAATFVNLAIG